MSLPNEKSTTCPCTSSQDENLMMTSPVTGTTSANNADVAFNMKESEPNLIQSQDPSSQKFKVYHVTTHRDEIAFKRSKYFDVPVSFPAFLDGDENVDDVEHFG